MAIFHSYVSLPEGNIAIFWGSDSGDKAEIPSIRVTVPEDSCSQDRYVVGGKRQIHWKTTDDI